MRCPPLLALAALVPLVPLATLPTAARAADEPADARGEAATRVAADVERLASDAFGGRTSGTPGHAATRAWLADRLGVLVGAGSHALAETPFALGVPDLASSRDLTITTATGTQVIRDAFRPLWGSPDRAAGALPLADGAGSVPLPGRLPDTTPEGLARFWRQVEDGTAPAVLVAPSPAARAALAPFLDTPTSLTEASTAELDRPGPDGTPRPRPPLAPWISSRRARAFPDAGPLRVPVLVLEEPAVAALEAAQPTRIDFAVTWGPGAAELAAGLGGVNLVAIIPAKDAPAERPSAVLVCAPYDALGTGDGTRIRGADDGAAGLACVLEALRGLPGTVTSGSAKHTLIVALLDGAAWGHVGARAAAASLTARYDLRAVVAVGALGRVRDNMVSVIGQGPDEALGAAAAAALAAAGLRTRADVAAPADDSDASPFHRQKVPTILLGARASGGTDAAADAPSPVDPMGVVRVAEALRGLLTTLLTS